MFFDAKFRRDATTTLNRGFSGVSEMVRPGRSRISDKYYMESYTASKEQLEELYELGNRFSPAVDKLTHGTIIKTTYKR
jgi:hypothetical protein